MNKSQLAFLSGITFVSIGLIPIARSIFSIELFNDAPIFLLVGGIWFLLIIIFFYLFVCLNATYLVYIWSSSIYLKTNKWHGKNIKELTNCSSDTHLLIYQTKNCKQSKLYMIINHINIKLIILRTNTKGS